MQAYSFDNVSFDFDFGKIDEKKHEEIIQTAEKQEKEEELEKIKREKEQ